MYTGQAAGMFNNGTATDYGTTVNSGSAGVGGIGTNAGGRGTGRNIFSNPQGIYNSVRYIQLSTDGRHQRGIARGLNNFNLDSSVGKKMKVGERFQVVFSADVLNVTNRVEFNNPSTSFLNPAAFGVISSQFNRPREIQLGLRIEF